MGVGVNEFYVKLYGFIRMETTKASGKKLRRSEAFCDLFPDELPEQFLVLGRDPDEPDPHAGLSERSLAKSMTVEDHSF